MDLQRYFRDIACGGDTCDVGFGKYHCVCRVSGINCHQSSRVSIGLRIFAMGSGTVPMGVTFGSVAVPVKEAFTTYLGYDLPGTGV